MCVCVCVCVCGRGVLASLHLRSHSTPVVAVVARSWRMPKLTMTLGLRNHELARHLGRNGLYLVSRSCALKDLWNAAQLQMVREALLEHTRSPIGSPICELRSVQPSCELAAQFASQAVSVAHTEYCE